VFAVGIALLFGLLAASSWWSNRENVREGSKLVATGDVLEQSHVPETYRAEFRVENHAGSDLTTTIEKIWVRRPFSSRVETWKDGKMLSVRHSAFGVLTSESPGSSAPLNIAVPPSLSGGDLRIDVALPEALKAKTIIRRERREVYGRQCQVYRSGGPVLAGDIETYKPREGTYADFCVDRNGIVLEEFWMDKDRLLRRRVATGLDVDVSIPDKTFAITAPENPDIHRGAVERIPKEPPTGEGLPLWTLPKTPKGWDSLGRYAVIISDQAYPRMNILTPSVAPASTSDVYLRGPDFFVVDQDPSLGALINLEKRISRDVQVGDLEEAKLIIDGRMNEVRGKTPDGSYIRIFGTLPTSDLLELADDLRPLEV
jgi:hypothetical protein